MPTDRRDLISNLYHAALARAPEERAAFLIEACSGDEALREEVESLLEAEPASARLLERPAIAVAAIATGATSMIDRRLGPYTIVAPLGAGGMGEVYRARDSKLGRDVAIKILPAHFTADAERRARFAREARTLATLNHPHIGAIYGLERSDGIAALVLELVEGPTLADRLEREPLPLAVALAIARQIIEALQAAHEKERDRPSRSEAGQHRPAYVRWAPPFPRTGCVLSRELIVRTIRRTGQMHGCDGTRASRLRPRSGW
jgi:serine/threonine protein kinase